MVTVDYGLVVFGVYNIIICVRVGKDLVFSFISGLFIIVSIVILGGG